MRLWANRTDPLMPSAILLAHIALGLGTSIQTDAAEVVRQSDAILQRANTVQGTYVISNGTGTSEPVEFTLEKPNHLVLRSGSKVDVFNGDDHYIALLDSRTYERRNVYVYGTPYLIGFTGFIRSKIEGRTTQMPVFGSARYVRVGDRSVVRRTSGAGGNAITVDIDPESKLPVRWSWLRDGQTYVASYQNVVLNQPVPNEVFDIPGLITGLAPKPTAEEVLLPAVGSTGVNVQGTTVQGRRFDLLETVAQKRATVIAFVQPDQANSLAATREIRDLVGKQKDAQLLLVVENTNLETARRYLSDPKYLGDRRFRTPALYGSDATAAASAYGVRLHPTVVILDTNGNVTDRMLGYDQAAFKAAIAAPSN